eukprot:CAMPEP_0181088158 /NCGR_PEP_ID=MMETSP1071-20121207/6640_1 /TAXON_ID=35127 /ORGANISM="Thalassiosira sp., Strain NH16" /LENGTH=479 /DNA_ID=CAMNT_0023170061 /DNA_START=126 /DNA_END=1565 /DNA_ORIENTATION=-
MTPSSLLLRYFEIAQNRLTTGNDDELDKATTISSLRSNQNLSWHRKQIVETQLASLDDAISEWERRRSHDGNAEVDSFMSRDSVQAVLREIGNGDFSRVSFDGDDSENSGLGSTTALSSTTGLRSRSSRGSGNGSQQSVGTGERGVVKDNTAQEQRLLLTGAVERTNELARRAYSRSVLIVEWRLELERPDQLAQYGMGELRGHGNTIDDESILEYCGLIMAAVRIPEVQQYLQNGNAAFIFTGRNDDGNFPSGDGLGCESSSVENRLRHIQQLCWRALGWESSHAMDQLRSLLSGESSDFEQITNNAKVTETLTKYSSAMTVAVTNASMFNIGESDDHANNDGTTRVVSVSYSEKIISVPNIDDNNEGHTVSSDSLSAPKSNTIDEHELSHQRRELDTAKAASVLQQQLWNEFQSLPPQEKTRMVEKSKMAHEEFLSKVTNTPPGEDRILLMQSIDSEVQKLLVIYKLWCSQSNSFAE